MAKKKRRRWDNDQKRQLLSEYEALDHGEKEAWRKRAGVSTSLISTWRTLPKEERPASPPPASPPPGARRGPGRPSAKATNELAELRLENTVLKAMLKLAVQKGMLD